MNGKQLAVILAFIGAAAVLLGNHHNTQPSHFEAWKNQHSISYANDIENAYREKIFLANLDKINAHNADPYNTYEMGLNQFSAMTQEEFAETYLTLKVDTIESQVESSDDVSIGDIDWTTQGAVTGVKNQGQCGSCWAFSATGGLEGMAKLEVGVLQSFSEQQLVDCAGIIYGNQGCNGGLMDNAFRYVKAKGIGLEQMTEMQRIIDAENSDLFDVLAYVAYALPTLTREERATTAKVEISTHFNIKQQAFLS